MVFVAKKCHFKDDEINKAALAQAYEKAAWGISAAPKEGIEIVQAGADVQLIFHQTTEEQNIALMGLLKTFKMTHQGLKGTSHHVTVTRWLSPFQTVVKSSGVKLGPNKLTSQ